jgi:hypothetical protein
MCICSPNHPYSATAQVTIPDRFNTATAGPRKCPAGAKLSKRGKCLSIDD